MSQPSSIHVQHEAGRQHTDFARRIEQISAECAPVTEDITGLLLPSRVTIRLVHTGEFIVSCQKDRERRFAAEVQELAPSAQKIKAARRELLLQRRGDLRRWLGVGAQTIGTADGGTEILMMPRGIRHAGRYDDAWWLHLALAHELCHPAQQRASGGTFITLRATPFPEERGVAGLALAALTEGHAMWAGRRAVTKILGEEPADQTPSRASRAWRKHHARHTNPAGSDSVYDDGTAFAHYVLEELGTGDFNRLWPRLDLAPSHEELATPEEWIKRLRSHGLLYGGRGGDHTAIPRHGAPTPSSDQPSTWAGRA